MKIGWRANHGHRTLWVWCNWYGSDVLSPALGFTLEDGPTPCQSVYVCLCVCGCVCFVIAVLFCVCVWFCVCVALCTMNLEAI